ncbi:MAG: prolipoprotein diacylglyceryl transferase [Oscillospiraceae bacterium]|nr:prolipoprotein diacylglyceryl transferase [Oscillospiraceae bacterium]
MYTEISFPSLGIAINPSSTFSIGPLTVHYYGLIIACGLVLAVIYACRRSKEFGISVDDLTDGVLWVTPFAIICARLYYCIFSWESGGYADNPISILYIWKGGLAIYGGVIGAAVGIIVFCKIKKIKIPMLLDLVSLGFLIGQALGRWGNFFNREAFGAETDFFLRMGLMSARTGEVIYVHPTFLYESVWNVVGFVLLHNLSKHRRYDGQVALGYVAWYGLGRAFIEGLRTDSLYIGSIRVSQLLAAVSCFAALAVLVWQSFKPHKAEDLFVNQVAAKKAAEQAEEETEQ